jgi:nucleoside-diphosphate-sugar epimerase
LKQLDAANFVRLFRDCSTRLIVASSGDVYRLYQVILGLASGEIDQRPVTEDSPLRDVLYPYRGRKSEYADYEKILVEREVMASGESCVLRLPAVYGPGDRDARFGPWLKRMRAGADLPMSELQAGWRWTHGYVENVAEAIALAAVDERSSGRIYNIGERETPTMRERALRLGHALGWRGSIVIVGEDELPKDLKQPGDLRQHLVMDSARIRRELGFVEIVSEREGLQTLFDFNLHAEQGRS